MAKPAQTASKAKSKFVKVGAVLKGKKSPFITLGNTKAKDPKYNYNVEVTVTDADGNVVASTTNGILTTLDPRKSQFAGEREIPDTLISEVFIVQE